MPAIKLIDMFLTDIHCVFSVVWNDFLNKIKVTFFLHIFKRVFRSSDILMPHGEALGIKKYICDTSTDSIQMNKFYVAIRERE